LIERLELLGRDVSDTNFALVSRRFGEIDVCLLIVFHLKSATCSFVNRAILTIAAHENGPMIPLVGVQGIAVVADFDVVGAHFEDGMDKVAIS
jgi:hypothetical protein